MQDGHKCGWLPPPPGAGSARLETPPSTIDALGQSKIVSRSITRIVLQPIESGLDHPGFRIIQFHPGSSGVEGPDRIAGENCTIPRNPCVLCGIALKALTNGFPDRSIALTFTAQRKPRP